MKVRSGLVSNSSSSSFIIATRKEMTEDALASVILDAFNVPQSSPLYELAKDMADCLANTRDHYTITELLQDYTESSTIEFSRYWPLIGNAIDNGFKHFYRGAVSNESDNTAELALVDIGLEYEGDDVVIEKEAGY